MSTAPLFAAPLFTARSLTVGHHLGRGARVVAKDLDLDLVAGELVCVLGRNGSGKSTLLATFAGLLPPLGGDLTLDGQALTSLGARARARRLAMVLPHASPLGPVTGWELAALGRYAHTAWTGRLGARDRRVIASALADAGASSLASRRVATLSDGERQKVQVARALAQEPKVLLLDEPTAFLDITARAELTMTLASLAKTGRAVVFSTHDLDLAMRYADRLWVLADGSLVSGTPAALRVSGDLERAFGSVVDGILDRGSLDRG